MLTFLEIQAKVDQICEKIGLEKKRVWPAVQNDGAPYVLIHENKYWYICVERGEVIFEKITKDFNELLYWIVDNYISSYSFEFELKNRTRGQDFRRIAFSKQMEIFGLISDEWKVKKENEIKKILEIAPFVDG